MTRKEVGKEDCTGGIRIGNSRRIERRNFEGKPEIEGRGEGKGIYYDWIIVTRLMWLLPQFYYNMKSV